eukprot:g4812.t1
MQRSDVVADISTEDGYRISDMSHYPSNTFDVAFAANATPPEPPVRKRSHSPFPLSIRSIRSGGSSIAGTIDSDDDNLAFVGFRGLSWNQLLVIVFCLFAGIAVTVLTGSFLVGHEADRTQGFRVTECTVMDTTIVRDTCTKQGCDGQIQTEGDEALREKQEERDSEKVLYKPDFYRPRRCSEQMYYPCYHAKWELKYHLREMPELLKKKEHASHNHEEHRAKEMADDQGHHHRRRRAEGFLKNAVKPKKNPTSVSAGSSYSE